MSKTTDAVVVREPRQERIAGLHENALRSAQAAVVCAIACGIELWHAKRDIPHGDFGAFVAATGVPERTAVRYMQLTQRMTKRLGFKSATVADLEVSPCGAALSEKSLSLLEGIRAVAEGKTLTQLYWEWGILRRSDRAGAGHAGGAKEKDEEAEAQKSKEAMRAWWHHFANDLHREGWVRRSWHVLAPDEKLALRQELEKVAGLIKAEMSGK